MNKVSYWLVVACMGISSVAWSYDQESSPVYIGQSVVPVILNVDLRTIPVAEPWKPGDPVKVVPEHVASEGAVPFDPDWVDPLVAESTVGSARYPVTNNFAGIAYTGVRPPDTVGDVGPNHYVQMVNATQLQIWDKNGNTLAGPIELSDLWDGAPSSECAGGNGDPIVVYDWAADRWFLSEFDSSANNLCFYISQGPDPVADGWFVYDFSAPNFPDYPQYGVWPDAYYVTSFEGSVLGLYAFDRDELLQGNAAAFQRFSIPALSGTSPRATRILPTDLDGTTPPPSGSPNFLIRSVHASQDSSNLTDRLEIFEFSVDWDTPRNSSVSLAQELPVADFNLLPCGPGVRDCVEQPGTANLLDALYNRVLRRAQYRNFGTYESIVLNQVVDAGAGVAGKRWWELRRPIAARGGADWDIHQEGTLAPDTASRFMGSIAVNGDGDIAIGYSISSDTIVPGIRFAGRHADTPSGTMLGETTILEGVGIQTNSQRWGDYSSLNIDPSDDRTFWFTSQYIQANNFSWATHIASFTLEENIFTDGFETP